MEYGINSGSLTFIDGLIVFLYFIFIVWLGTRFGKRQKSSVRYFLGIRKLPGWAVGMSMFATIISSWSFIALPGKAFKNDLQYLMVISSLPITTFIAARYLIPLFRGKIRLSAYEFLESRFGLPARVYGNVAFIVVHFGKMGAILYLLCMAISSMTGWNIFFLIGIVGITTIIYTCFGGIEGVVWSDVAQGLLLLGGGIISLIYLLPSAPGGVEAILSTAASAHKLKLVSLDIDWNTVSVFVLFVFGWNYFLQKYTSDQTVVQRYLLSPSKKQATHALWMSSLLIMFVWVLFMSIGALLWSFYRIQTDLLPAALWDQPDTVFPYFIGHQLPVGVSGLILAGLLASTMSTLSSDLNSLGAVLFDDYYNKIRPGRTERQRLLFSRLSVLISGLLAVGLAMWMTRIHSMADAAFQFVSLVAGGVLGMYALGVFIKRCSPKGLYIGLVVGIVCILWAYFTSPGQSQILIWLPRFPLNTLWIGLFGNLVVFSVGYLASKIITPGFEAPDVPTILDEAAVSED